MTVRRYRLSSSGETTRQGRVFWISLPSVGSSRTRWTSPRARAARATATPIPRDRTGSRSAHRAGGHGGPRTLLAPLPPSPLAGAGSPGPRAAQARHVARLRRGAALDPAGPSGRGYRESSRSARCVSWSSCGYNVATDAHFRNCPHPAVPSSLVKALAAAKCPPNACRLHGGAQGFGVHPPRWSSDSCETRSVCNALLCALFVLFVPRTTDVTSAREFATFRFKPEALPLILDRGPRLTDQAITFELDIPDTIPRNSSA